MARESFFQVAILCNLIVSTIWITSKAGTTAVVERPFHLAIVTLLFCSILWLGVNVCFRERRRLNDGEELLNRKDDGYTKTETHSQRSKLWRRWSRVCSIGVGPVEVMICYIVLRVILIRWIRQSVQCSWDGVELFLPFWLLIIESSNGTTGTFPPNFRIALKIKATNISRSLILLAIWMLSGLAITWLSAHKSTYICPLGDSWRHFIRFIQYVGVGLDACLLSEISKLAQGQGKAVGKSWGSFSKIAFLSATILGVIASANLWTNVELIPWSFHLDHETKVRIVIGSLLCANWIGSVVYLLHDTRPVTLSIILCSLWLFVSQILLWPFQFSNSAGFRSYLLVGVCLTGFLSMVGLVRAERDATRAQRPLSLQRDSMRMLTGLVFLMGAALLGSAVILHFHSKVWKMHPISLLITRAKADSLAWTAQAGASKTLAEAVVAYQARYGIYPPPNFDKWYEFAVERNSAVIDNFDQINSDLFPFWGMEPSEIRRLTGHMLEHPWTEVGGVRISNKTASIGPHMPPTHRWMVEGAVDIINKFVEHLPDMDLAFNINDESRVAVPWEEMEQFKVNAMVTRLELNKTKMKLRTSFFPHVIDVWDGSFMKPEPPNGPDVISEFFEGASFRSSFEQYGTIGCSPNSLARQQKWSDIKAFCQHCPAPHLLDSFVSKWALSGSLCHQPDLANLHGFHMSPSAFRSTNKLFPIFSQSKVPTFNDIIFPSPWNYRDKVVHDEAADIPFFWKEDAVFWRGATSEGFSLGGTWQGMQRQRFVHLVNNAANSTVVNLIIPSHGKYRRQAVSLWDIKDATRFNVSFVGGPVRCDKTDAAIQAKEFAFGNSVEFQDHWQYKYLFDLDGAGFSGRFLPFLQSRSLVFRAATFRQWFDERLVAWKHFVPVDGRLDDVWALLAYFSGIGSKERSGHSIDAEHIADDGRKWAEKVLRKEDMEVYMFRLLLEWGRIVDDRRTQMGFVMPSVP